MLHVESRYLDLDLHVPVDLDKIDLDLLESSWFRDVLSLIERVTVCLNIPPVHMY